MAEVRSEVWLDPKLVAKRMTKFPVEQIHDTVTSLYLSEASQLSSRDGTFLSRILLLEQADLSVAYPSTDVEQAGDILASTRGIHHPIDYGHSDPP
jgi:hypothetical protein